MCNCYCSKDSCYGKKELEVLLQLSDMLSEKQIDLDKALQLLCVHFAANRVILTVVNRENNTIKIEASYGVSDEEKKNICYNRDDITGKVITTGRTMLIHKVKDEPSYHNLTNGPLVIDGINLSFISTPVRYKNEIIGSISILKLYKVNYTFDGDARMLKIFSNIVGRTLHRRQEYAEEIELLKKENSTLRHELNTRINPGYIKGNSSKMREVFDLIYSVAPTDSTVLIRGESGVGKELIADALQLNSTIERRHHPYIKVNCAALPENLIESELFGHEKGAFTGAEKQHLGHFEAAEGGTIFLDEIGEMSLSIQAKLLRVLQQKEIIRLGSTRRIKVNVRVICATNENLEQLISEGNFREDLYYRINVFPIFVPPLRERVNDIPVLVNYFIEKYSKQFHKNITRITAVAIDMLMIYSWPGNIRELENCIERACILSNDGVIRSQNLPPTLQTADSTRTQQKGSLDIILGRLEKQTLIDALTQNKGNMAKSAMQLGITERMIGIRIKKYDINPQVYKRKEK
jgi:Nif-specific regulatory protein